MSRAGAMFRYVSIVERERDRARGALLGTFVGDALGMPFERAAPADVPKTLEMVEARLGRGTYTDDTQMMIALAESLIECGRIDPDHLSHAFIAAYDPRRGYGSGTTQVLQLIRGGADPQGAARSLFGGQGSQGNGAAMRIAPVAVRYPADRDELVAAARAAAHATHAHAVAVDAAVTQAVAIAAAASGEDPLEAARQASATPELERRLADADELRDSGADPSEVASALGNGSRALDSVVTAIYAAAVHRSPEAAVSFAVRCGGDADTIGAMAGAIAGAGAGASAIPKRWLDALENGAKGRDHVTGLADALFAAAQIG